jgi:hypothetical protein
MDARGDASKDPGSVLECLHVSAAANSQEPKTSGRNKPADELSRNIILRRKCRPNRAKEGRIIKQCILEGILAPRGPPSSDSDDGDSSESKKTRERIS